VKNTKNRHFRIKPILILLCFLVQVFIPIYSVNAQVNLARETLYYIKLIETGEKLNGIYGKVEDVKSKTSFFRDAVYKVRNKQQINSLSGTLISSQAKVLIEQIVTYSNNYNLPEFESIPVVSGPVDGSKQAISRMMTSLTEASVFYETKLKDYESKQQEVTILMMKLRELKRENTRAAKILEDVIRSGGLAIGQQALFNDWYNFNIIFSKSIGEAISELNLRKKRWETTLKRREAEYQRFKSNTLLGLQLEKTSIQKTFDEAEKQSKAYEKKTAELEDQIRKLEILKDHLLKVESDINYYQQQIKGLESSNNSYRRSLSNLRDKKDYIKSKRYELNYGRCNDGVCSYGKCPNNHSYENCCGSNTSSNCGHPSQGIKFRNKRSSDRRKVEKQISSYENRISNNNARIDRNRSTLSTLNAKRQQIFEQLKELPRLQQELKAVQDERAEFMDRIDIYYAFELMFINNRNINLINNL
jgi:chromosome segregation ATPase